MKYHEKYDILESTSTDPRKQTEVGYIMCRYEKFPKIKKTWWKKRSMRGIEKHSMFTESLSNIKLTQFNGLNCLHDLHTFQSNTEKLHLGTTYLRAC